MRFELRRLQRELGITSVYVTHDQVEALSMSSRIAVMNGGRVEQIGTPREVYEQPATRFVADFIGSTNLLTGNIVASGDGDHWKVSTPAGDLVARSQTAHAEGDQVVVMMRPEHIKLREGDAAADADWTGVVTARAFQGDSVEHKIRVRDVIIQVRCHSSVSVPPETTVGIDLDPTYCLVIL